MKILSLDTTMAACSAAVIDTESTLPLAVAFEPMERGHAEALPPMVAAVMTAAGLGFPEIDRIAVTVGPGTFTGVRIGLAFARGLGLARGTPVIGIDSLTAISANETAASPLLVVSDARNDEVYAALYDADRNMIEAPRVTTAGGAAQTAPGGTCVIGTAARLVIAASQRDGLTLSQAGNLPVARQFARLAGHAPVGAMPQPLYLRAPDAKPQSTPLRKISTLTIDAVGPSAAGLLSALHEETFPDGWSETAFAAMLETPGTDAAVAREDGEPLAFIVTRRALDEAEIITIGSRPGMQRRGVARSLLIRHIALLAAQGVRQVFLEVAASNTAAQALYLACGFTEAGRRKNYYRRGSTTEDAIVMRRGLLT